MSDVDDDELGGAGVPEESTAPPLLYLGEPLPSSVTRLGLSPAPSTPSSRAATAAGANGSFRVVAVHIDDVAEDVILACEDSITLLIPLEPTAAAQEMDLGGVRQQQQQQQQASPSSPSRSTTTPIASTPALPTAAPAACLRMAGAVQVWTHPAALPSSTSGLSSAATPRFPSPPPSPQPPASPLAFSGCGTASTSGLCLPRRLPSTVQELRRAPAVLVAVPVPPLSASAALQNARPPLASAQGSFAASTAAPPTSPPVPPPVMALYIMACPVLPEGVDGIEPGAAPLARPLAKYVCAPNTLRFRDAWYPVLHLSWCNRPSPVPAAASSSTACDSSPAAAHSQSVFTTGAVDADDEYDGNDDGSGAAASVRARYVDHHLLCASSICVDLIQVRCAVGSAAAASVPAVTVTVLQRYVTRTDWCTYDPCSRVLLCLNHARPTVLKPLEVYTRVCPDGEEDVGRGGVPQVALRTWAELPLSERLCGALPANAGTATSAAASEVALRRLQAPSVVGALTVYGQSCVYHVTQRRCAGGGAHDAAELVLQLHLHLPGKLATAPAASARPSPPLCPTGQGKGARDGEGAPAAAAGSSTGSHDSLLRRWTTAASAASASAPPPDQCDGDTYLPVAQLSLSELTAVAATGSAGVWASPLSSSFVSSAASSSLLQQQQQQQHPRRGPLPIAVQVVDNLLLVHSPMTGQSAVFDLADRGSSRGVGGTGDGGGSHRRQQGSRRQGAGSLTSRAYVLWAAASDASRAWARSHRPQHSSAVAHGTATATAAGAATSPAPRGTPASHRDSNVSFASTPASHPNPRVHTVHESGADDSEVSEPVTITPTSSSPASPTLTSTSTTLSSPPLRHAQAPLRPVPPRTPTSLTSPLLLQANRLRLSPSTSPPRNAVAAPDFASMLSVLRASVMELAAGDAASSHAAVTAGGDVTRGTPGAAPASAAPWVDALYCGPVIEGADAASAAYAPYRWLTSSRLPLAIAVESGDLHWCRVGAARVSGWRLLVGMCDAADSVHSPREQHHDGVLDTRDTGVALVRSYVGLLCRRRHPFACQSSHSTGSARVLIQVLRELAALLIGTGDRDDGESGSLLQPHGDRRGSGDTTGMSDEEREVFRCLLLCASTASGTDADDNSDAAASTRLYEVWHTVLECLTVETALLASCDGAGLGARNEAGAKLQRLVIESAFLPLWAAVRGGASATSNPSSTTAPAAPSTAAASAGPAMRLQRLRLEGLLCDYVRLLHSFAASVDPQLQHLLLEVVLGDAVFAEVAASPSTPPQPPPWTAAASGAVAEAARRVQRLLRQGTLESNDATARWLLDWWGTYHVAATAATQRRAAAAAQSAATAVAPLEEMLPGGAAAAASPTELPAVPSSESMAEAEVVFTEAVRLLEAHGSLLEVAEAHSWRSDFTAAAAVLQRVPRIRGEMTHVVPAVASWPAASHRRGTRVLAWDALALAALDGAWRGVRWAEEALYTHTAGGGRRLRSVQHQQRTVSGLDLSAPKTWAAQALERQVQVAHCTYMTMATTLLARAEGGGADAGHAAAENDALFHAHEMRCEQLRRQMEVAWQELKVRGEG